MTDYVTINEHNNLVKRVEDGLKEFADDRTTRDKWQTRIEIQLENMWKAFKAPSQAMRIFTSKWMYVLVPVLLAGTMAWMTAVYSSANEAKQISANQCIQIKQLRDQRLSSLTHSLNAVVDNPKSTPSQIDRANAFFVEAVGELPVVNC